MANLLEHAGQKLFETFLDKRKGFEIFSMLDVWGYLIEVAKGDGRVAGCGLKVEREGDHYKISQFMLNKRDQPILSRGDFVLGHVWEAYDLDDGLLEVFKAKKIVRLSLEALKPEITQDDEEDV